MEDTGHSQNWVRMIEYSKKGSWIQSWLILKEKNWWLFVEHKNCFFSHFFPQKMSPIQIWLMSFSHMQTYAPNQFSIQGIFMQTCTLYCKSEIFLRAVCDQTLLSSFTSKAKLIFFSKCLYFHKAEGQIMPNVQKYFNLVH